MNHTWMSWPFRMWNLNPNIAHLNGDYNVRGFSGWSMTRFGSVSNLWMKYPLVELSRLLMSWRYTAFHSSEDNGFPLFCAVLWKPNVWSVLMIRLTIFIEESFRIHRHMSIIIRIMWLILFLSVNIQRS